MIKQKYSEWWALITVLSTWQELALLLSYLSLFFRTDSTEEKYLENEETGKTQCPLFLKGQKTPLAIQDLSVPLRYLQRN